MQKMKLLSGINTATNHYFKLIIIAGPFKSGKTALLKEVEKEFGYKYINLNLLLTKLLMENKEDSYKTKSQHLIREMCESLNDQIIFVDNIELMFSREVGKLNPIEVFKGISRGKTVVLSIPGKVRGSKIFYSSPDRNDYLEMDASGITVVETGGE